MGDSLNFPPIKTPQDILSKVNSQTTKEDLKPIQDYTESLISDVQKQRLPVTEVSDSSRRPPLSESSEISDLDSLKDEVQKALHKLGGAPAEHEAKAILLNIMDRIQKTQNIYRSESTSQAFENELFEADVVDTTDHSDSDLEFGIEQGPEEMDEEQIELQILLSEDIALSHDILSKVHSETTKEDLLPIKDYLQSLINRITGASDTTPYPLTDTLKKGAANELNALKTAATRALETLKSESSEPSQVKIELNNIIRRIDIAERILGKVS